AEDGIRDSSVTGVQTCALPISAAAVVEEVLTLGPLEVGVGPRHRCTLELARTVRRATSQPTTLSPRDVVLVTGGARGVTAEAARSEGRRVGRGGGDGVVGCADR